MSKVRAAEGGFLLPGQGISGNRGTLGLRKMIRALPRGVLALESGASEGGRLTEAEVEALAARVCELLAREPHVGRLADAIAERLSAPEGRPPELPPAPADPDGPVPIGPYEIAPEFRELKWDGEPPLAPEWRAGQRREAAETGQVPPAHAMTGPRVTRKRPPNPVRSSE
jgi:hypothetical protein